VTLWRALLEGVGWRLGKEAAEDAIRSLRGDGEPAQAEPVETPEARAKRLERELRAAEKARAEAKKAAEKKKAADARDVETELRELKKKLGRDGR
jgi:hypothetical protein